jgi:bifunctional non-homologous end joining protein LigD
VSAPAPDEVSLSNLDRVVFPGDGVTKGDVVRYYRAVAPRMVPFLRGRPLSLERFRTSIDEGGFFQQSAARHFPDWVPRVRVRRRDGKVGLHPGCDSPAALVYLANQGTLTFHGWAARAPALERPDRLAVDLDPDGDDFAPVRDAALHLRAVLDEHGLVGCPMTTGSRGLHVILPLDGSAGWEELWTFAKALGAALVKRAPKELTRAFYRSQRRGRLYVDTARARRGHLAIMPWTVRARPGAPVAMPLRWEELSDPSLGARKWTLRDALERPEDPWEGAAWRGQDLAAAAASLGV